MIDCVLCFVRRLPLGSLSFWRGELGDRFDATDFYEMSLWGRLENSASGKSIEIEVECLLI